VVKFLHLPPGLFACPPRKAAVSIGRGVGALFPARDAQSPAGKHWPMMPCPAASGSH